ncbi:Restriction endonuclease [Acetitomaculum ruminis DSM 5522]|uniref:Restriction endonuclease n=1 Tax=Acetitomaculum ruminis DSM 5522 TaxID=1120918 RepID=A0A1I0XQ89_9FIRM|nr:restriction endonuclease [Acetitomaculum ruminis]SFB03142.1 Restriction endonuclease [Acetitomaculum ruminis DSM 5522]
MGLLLLPFQIIFTLLKITFKLLDLLSIPLKWLYGQIFGFRVPKAKDGYAYEYVCAELLRRNGFKNVDVTVAIGDQGVDVLATKKGLKYAIQCKYYSGYVGNKAVQEVYAGMEYYGCDVGVVMTNSYFSKSAIELAESTGIILLDHCPVKVKRKRSPFIFWGSLLGVILGGVYMLYKNIYISFIPYMFLAWFGLMLFYIILTPFFREDAYLL